MIVSETFSELNALRDMLMHKFGREFSLAVVENKDDCVPARVRSASWILS